MPCKWEAWQDSEGSGCYDTECEQVQYFSEGNIKENNYKYCPYCGDIIEEVFHENE